MKTIVKVFVVVLGMLFISSCSSEPTTETYDAVEFEYNGHSYIRFRVRTWKFAEIIGTVHNPDCECYKEDK